MNSPQRATQFALPLLPGIVLTTAVALLGLASSEWIGESLLGFASSPISGIMMAILFGLLIGNIINLPHSVQPGIRFSLKRILRLGIILLGIRLSLGDVLRFGSLALPLIIFCILGAVLFMSWLGRQLNVSQRLSTLIAVGTSICGATAIVATAPAIEAKQEETTYAVANITVFGILAMLLYPYLAHTLFGNDMTGAGLFLGTSIHETAQVAGSGLIYAQVFDADPALDVATVTKLIRNVFIAFMVPYMTFRYRQQVPFEGEKRGFFSLFPVFILGFIGMAALRTIGDVMLDSGGMAYGLFNTNAWITLTKDIQHWSERFLAIAMAGVGLGTSIKQLQNLGLKPFYAGLGASACVGLLSLIGIATLQVIGAY